MKRNVLALSALLVFAAGVTPAAAQLQTKNQAKCIVGVNKAAAKMASSVRRVGTDCIRNSVGGQDILACITADSKGRILKATEKVNSLANGACVADTPAFGFAGAAAVNTGVLTQERALAQDVFGEAFITGELSTNPDAATRTCRNTVANDYGRLSSAITRAFVDCKKNGLAAGAIDSLADLQACLGQTTAASSILVAKAQTTLMLDLISSCDILGLGDMFPGACEDSFGVLSFGECIDKTVRCRTCLGLNAIDGMSADCDAVDDGSVNYTCPPGSVAPTTTTTTSTTHTTLDTTTTTLDTTTTTLDTTTTTTTSTTVTTTTTSTTTTTLPGVLDWTFGNACVDVSLNVPTLGGEQRIKGPGMIRLQVDMGSVANVPGGNGRSQVNVEIADLYLNVQAEGDNDYSTVTLYPETGLPLNASHTAARPSVGKLAETVRNTRDQLDITPFGDGGIGVATIATWIHAEIFTDSFGVPINAQLHHDTALTLSGTFNQLPPLGTDSLAMTNASPLAVKQDSNDAGFLSATITSVILTFDDPVCAP